MDRGGNSDRETEYFHIQLGKTAVKRLNVFVYEVW